MNNNEINFILELLEKSKRKWSGNDVVLENSKLHNVDIYFLQQKLEEMLN